MKTNHQALTELEKIKQELKENILLDEGLGDFARNVKNKVSTMFSKSPSKIEVVKKSISDEQNNALAEIGNLLGIKAKTVEDLLTSNKINKNTKEKLKTFFNDYASLNQILNVDFQSDQKAKSPVFKKIEDLTVKFSREFTTNFKHLAKLLNDPDLIKYAEKFNSYYLKEMMTNPAVKMKDRKETGKFQPDYVALRSSLVKVIGEIGKEIKSQDTSAKGIMKKIKNTNLITADEKTRLITFINNHLKVIKFLRTKLTQQKDDKTGGSDYSIEESFYEKAN